MRTFGKFLGRVIFLLVLVLAGMWVFGPYEQYSVVPTFDESAIGDDIDAYLAAEEAQFDDIIPGVEKRVVWHSEPGGKTDTVLVYIHGWQAMSEEIRPVPDLLAAELGANLIYTRLEGHGRTGEALAKATVDGWMNDAAEALAIARRIGDRIILIGTSTGATIVAEAALQPELVKSVAGVILISPNFGFQHPLAGVATWPAARYWVPLIEGQERNWSGHNEKHDAYWTNSYPTVAAMPMAWLVNHATRLAFEKARTPALFWFSDADTVVRPDITRDFGSRWGGPSEIRSVTLSDGDDPNAHVITGDILSPGQTQKAVVEFFKWIKDL